MRRITNTVALQLSFGSRVVSVQAEGPGFKSQSRRCRVTVLGKLFTPIAELSMGWVDQWVELTWVG